MYFDFKRLRNSLRGYFPFLVTLGKAFGLVYSERSFLNRSGYIASAISKKPCRKDGSPVPWMNYNVVSFFQDRLRKDLSLFEYGSGYSTLFFSNYVGDIISVECDREWYDYINANRSDNTNLLLYEDDPYASDTYSKIICGQGRKFDVVIVDAEDRNRCMISACDAISDWGVIVLDDSHRPCYRRSIDWLIGSGFKRLDFEGLKPGRISLYRTTIFYKSDNCLGI